MSPEPRPTWVHPGLLSASCLVATDEDTAANKWLRPSTHLRVFPSAQLGYPLCPFTVWHAGGVRRLAPVLSGSGDYMSSGIGDDTLLVGGWGHDGSLSVLDAAWRESGRCTRMSPFVARVPLRGLRYHGTGRVATASYEDGLQVDGGKPVPPDWVFAEPIDAIGAPLPEGAWWSGIDPGFTSADLSYRVQAGVPDTALPYDAFQPADALRRAQALAAGIEDDVQAAWQEGPSGTPPVAAQVRRTLPGNKGAEAVTGMSVALWAASVDAAAARWWGFGTTLPYDASCNEEYADCFAVAGLFVVVRNEHNEPLLKLATESQNDPMADVFRDRLYDVHAGQGLNSLIDDITSVDREVVCLWTIAVAAHPPDQPDPPGASVPTGNKTWNDDGTWTAKVSVHGALGGPLAVLRDPDVPLNSLIAEGEPWRQPIVARPIELDPGAVAVTDRACPDGPASWHVANADLWGQWSSFGTGASVPPDIPPLATPTVVLELLAADPPAGTAPTSAGDVFIRATLPPSSPAAPAVTSLEADLTGASSPVTLTDDGAGLWAGQATVDPTSPAGSVSVQCSVTAHDAAGRTTTGSASLLVHDPRPFVAPLTSAVILYTGDRRPDGFAELDVRTPVPAGTPSDVTWRLYVADEQALPAIPAASEPRWSRANALRAQIDAAPTRARMAQLTAAAVTRESGHLRVRAQLPGRLESVQVMQLVATTTTGLEAPSNQCGSFAVAVPLGDVPPAPTVTHEIDSAGTTVSLAITVAYPGTRPGGDPPPRPVSRRGGSATTPLRARVRRSATGTDDPTTWPVLAIADLDPANPTDPTAGWRWSATITDTLPATTPAWAPLSYVCEVAWPDEPAWNPAATPVPGAVAPTWGTIGARPSVWSAPSTGLTVLAPRPAIAATPAYVDNGDGTATITVPVVAAHPRAKPWSMTAMADPSTGLPAISVIAAGPELRIDNADASVGAAGWLLAVVAPDGTSLPIVAADGTALP